MPGPEEFHFCSAHVLFFIFFFMAYKSLLLQKKHYFSLNGHFSLITVVAPQQKQHYD